jgi:hypothetical protein
MGSPINRMLTARPGTYDALFERLRQQRFYGTFTFQFRAGEVVMIDSRRQFKSVAEAIQDDTRPIDFDGKS